NGLVGPRPIPLDDLDRVDRHLPLGELDRLARAGHRVGAAARDLDGAVVGWPLTDRAAERVERGFGRIARGGRTLGRRESALEVVGRRGGAEADRRPVALAITE